MYTANPRDRKSFRNQTSFKPVSKELCLDVDLTDYDDIRTCCTGAGICRKCWTFATMAMDLSILCGCTPDGEVSTRGFVIARRGI